MKLRGKNFFFPFSVVLIRKHVIWKRVDVEKYNGKLIVV